MKVDILKNSAKLMSSGKVTIPKDARKFLGVSSGDYVYFIVEGNSVRIVNSATYAMETLQKDMEGETKLAGLNSDDDVIELVKEVRSNG